MAEAENELPTLVPVAKPLSLIPVGLKEAALDSPTFRATAVHLSDQFDAIERWLEGYVRAASKVAQEAAAVDSLINSFIATSTPPNVLSEALIDHDYTLTAMQRFGEDARDFWTHIVAGMTKIQGSVVEPVRSFLYSDTRAFKDARRQLESSQKQYDALLARYYSQAKSKEPSALREDAFQVHEARKAYVKASMDFCVLAPQLNTNLNSLLIEVFSDQWLDMKTVREASTQAFTKHAAEIDRIRYWSRDVGKSENVSKLSLLLARRDIEAAALAAARPSRDLDGYAASTVPFSGGRPPAVPLHPTEDAQSTRQGWLFLRTITGKPSRTTWIRRWFFVNNGIFGWLVQGSRSGGVEESEKIGVLLCNVRPAPQEERRFCFEVKTKDTTILLQAESQLDLTQWISVFDIAKQKAFEQPAINNPSAGNLYSRSDAAFAVTPATAPELAARKPDGQVAKITEDLSGSLHTVEPENIAGLTQRHSMDVNLAKRISEKADGDRSRDHAARLIHKLDLHRKSTAGTQLSSGHSALSSSGPGGGIASLISASHSALPISPIRSDTGLEKRDTGLSTTSVKPLAPSSLANPPAPTNLSKTTVMIGAERGLDMGMVDGSGGVPSGVLANQWGSINHGHISRLERGEVKSSTDRSVSASNTPFARRESDPTFSEQTTSHSMVPHEATSQLSPPLTPSRARSGSVLTDQSRISELETPLPPRRVQTGFADFPVYYPHDLKAHDAQFRMLFPNVPQDDRVVLVFRASWNPDDKQNLPGRVFVTMNDMYFYSNHFGFVLVSGVDLSTVTDISSSSSESHDLLFLRVEGRTDTEEATLITIKTFLEPVRLLQRRLNFLASNCSAEEPVDLEEVLQQLVKQEGEFEAEQDESFDELSRVPSGVGLSRFESARKTGIRVDRNLYSAEPIFADGPESIKFRLPSEPVVYTPKDMEDLPAEQVFKTSAKALFHIIFGDRSVVSQTLYYKRRSQKVMQSPWTHGEDKIWRRQFEYEAEVRDFFMRSKTVRLVDSQSVDLTNDHLCYVVTDLKAPWHLPYGDECLLVTKFVITHVAKSRCHLKVFTKVAWKRKPVLFWRLVQRYGMNDLRVDAQDLLTLVSDQVQKLGPNCTTKRAIEIFGHLGHHTEGVLTAADKPLVGGPNRTMIQQRALTTLLLEAGISFAAGIGSTILMSLVGLSKAIYNLISAQTLLLLLFLVSVSFNFIGTTQIATSWWRDYSAASFMARLGVGPNIALSRAVYLRDINEMLVVSPKSTSDSTSKCAGAFSHILQHSDPSASVETETTIPYATSLATKSSARRLRRTRQRMATYRHDLLVSMRVVNSIERETVQAEYENWLIEETTKCRQIGEVLDHTDSNYTKVTHGNNGTTADESKNPASKLAAQLGYENLAHLRDWYGEYCGSCYREHGQVFPSNTTVTI